MDITKAAVSHHLYCAGFGGCRALLGSVSDYAAHHVDCPVLIVKMPSSKQASGIDDLVSGMEKLGHSTAPAA